MIVKIVIAISATLALLLGWLFVQQVTRTFSKNHPEFGPAREDGQGCGSSCGCKGKTSCKKRG